MDQEKSNQHFQQPPAYSIMPGEVSPVYNEQQGNYENMDYWKIFSRSEFVQLLY